METGAKKIGFSATIGVIFALIIIIGVIGSGVYLPSTTPSDTQQMKLGTLMVLLTDAPVELEHLNITIDSLSARNVDNDTEAWIDIPFVYGKDEVYFDLLALQNVTMNLAITEMPVGNYSKMRMTVTTANATYTDGNTTDLRVPSGHLDIKIDFEIKAGETRALLIDMQADWVAISNSGNLRPVFKATVAQQL